jgi:hypothetical protein
MPLWFLIALSLLHLGGMVSCLVLRNYPMAVVLLGGAIVNIGLSLHFLR